MSRIQAMIDRLEAGEDFSRVELKRLLRLQALDVARAGEVFVEEYIERENQADARS